MSKKTLLALVVLLVVLSGIIWLTRRKPADNQANTPVLSVSAFNQTKNVSATSLFAQPGDVIVYTLNAENQGSDVISGYVLEVNIADVSNDATLVDADGASYNSATNSLVWTPLDIPANGQISKQISFRINTLAAGSDSVVLKLKFNNEIDISASVPSPVVAGGSTEVPSSGSTAYSAPKTGPSEDLAVFMALATTAAYFVIRRYRVRRA